MPPRLRAPQYQEPDVEPSSRTKLLWALQDAMRRRQEVPSVGESPDMYMAPEDPEREGYETRGLDRLVRQAPHGGAVDHQEIAPDQFPQWMRERYKRKY